MTFIASQVQKQGIFLQFTFVVDFLSREFDLLWPSEGTKSNQKTILQDDDDLRELMSEYDDFPHEKILEAHYACRLRDCSSDITIRSVLGMKLYICRFNYETQYESFE